jgi:hypothetical protein
MGIKQCLRERRIRLDRLLDALGLPFERIWLQLGQVFALTGILNAVLCMLYRTVDYWHETTRQPSIGATTALDVHVRATASLSCG